MECIYGGAVMTKFIEVIFVGEKMLKLIRAIYVFKICRLGNLRQFFTQNRRLFLDDFQVILDDSPPFRRFLDDFLKVTKYHF
jgi:hypothetical protein